MMGARRYNVLACGRRFGKTTLAQDCVIRTAVAGNPVAWCGPTFASVLDTWEQLRRVLLPVMARPREREHRLELQTGGLIEMWSLEDPDPIRGRAYSRIVVDEAASVPKLQYAWENVLRPTLADTQGDAWFLSTPKGLGYFHRLYLRGLDAQEPEWTAFRFPSSANPHLLADEIEAARRDLPERVFAQEFLAEFLESEGAVFRRVLEAVREPGDVPASASLNGDRRPQYVIGVDWARVKDFTVFCALDVERKHVAGLDRFREIDYPLQLDRLKVFTERFPPLRVIAERNAMGDPLVSSLRRAGFPVWPYLTTQASKAAAIEALALAFERSEVTIPNDRTLIGELLSYHAEKLPSGLLRYDAPTGAHDDCVMALALAWQAVAHPTHSAADVRKVYGW